ncbi:MAG: class I SAM-dependent methyltransferase [bacterium]|nr:class I SAM-dependent methyltransferase [bacterium]
MNQDNYTRFAPFYDELEFDTFSQQCVEYLTEFLPQLNFQGKTVLDLACGTGTAAILLAKSGYQVTGIDISAPMIRIAKQKAKSAKLPVRFYCRDMRTINFRQRYDLATCFFDAMNHLYTYRDFAQVCRNVSRVLKPNGIFIFDLNTEYGLKTHWRNKRSEQRKQNLRSIFRSTYNSRKKIATVTATLYITQRKRTKLITTKFMNRAYTAEQVHRAMQNAGLALVAEYDCFTFTPATKTSSRIMYIAKKINGF